MPTLTAKSTAKPRSQRDLLAQLKQLVAASGNEKKFLLAHEALNVDKVGRTTVYDALHNHKIGVKLEGLLNAIKAQQDKDEATDAVMGEGHVKAKARRSAKRKDDIEKRELSRPISAYVKQLQSLITASGSERKFFTDYARFNVAGAVRSSVYTAVHDGKVRSALAVMLDGINDDKPVRGNGSGKVVKSRKAKAVHGIEILPEPESGDDFAEGDDAQS